MTVRLADVAALAEVGESTVSRVLRDAGSFSSSAREKVLKAAAELGYVPNRLASSLASAGSRLVAIIVPSLANVVFVDVLKGAEKVLDQTGYRGVFGVTDYDPGKEELLVEALLEYRPAAVLLAGLEHTERTRAMLSAAGCRIVEILDTDGDCLDLAVGFSNKAAGQAAAEHLLACSYERIGYVGHDLTRDRRAARRFETFRRTLETGGVTLADSETGEYASSAAQGRASLSILLRRSPDLQAVYFSNDDLAIGGFFHCMDAAIRVPDQLAIFGHNGLDIGQAMPQPLSTIRPPREEIGRVAVEMALSGAASQIVDVGFEILTGRTTAAWRQEQPDASFPQST